MARICPKSVIHFTIFAIFISLGLSNPTKDGLVEEKLTHFRVYLHITISGSNPNTVTVVRSPNNETSSLFGMIAMMDGYLTMCPKLESKLVGRAQGLYASVSQTEMVMMMAMSFVFVEGKYNGSTISILGRNAIMTQVREMPIIGGSGLFRFAGGYVQVRTHTYDLKTGYAILEYNTGAVDGSLNRTMVIQGAAAIVKDQDEKVLTVGVGNFRA